jgi:hypothetical protein
MMLPGSPIVEREQSVRSWIAVLAGMAVVMAGAGFSSSRAAEEARSRLLAGRTIATNYAIRLADFQELSAAAQKKYGPKANTVMQGGTVTTTVDGKVMETSTLKARVVEVFGMLTVGPRRNDMARFPFAMNVSGEGERPQDVGETVRARFQKQAPSLFDFNDFDWVNLWCWTPEAPDLGAKFADANPRLGKASLCLVRWRRGDPKVMLIGALVADGGAWVRDASRPLCRTLVERWLDAPEVAQREHTVDYAGCVLVHDPDAGARGPQDTVVEHIYEVRPDHSLLVIN